MKRILFTLALIALTALLLVILATGFVELFLWISGIFGLHKELGTSTQTTENYAFVSGIGPIVITTLGFSGLLVTAWKHWNCHEPTVPPSPNDLINSPLVASIASKYDCRMG